MIRSHAWHSVYALLAFAGFSPVGRTQSLRLMGISGISNVAYCELSAENGMVVQCHSDWTSTNGVVGLLWSSGSMYVVELRMDNNYYLVRVNPASGGREDLGVVFQGPWAIYGLAADPTTQSVTFIGSPDGVSRHQYVVDLGAVTATVLNPHVFGWVGSMGSMAIDPNGDVWFITQGQRLWRFDVAAGMAFHHGYVAGLPSQFVANAAVAYLACREPGVLYADVRTGASQTIESGIFRIDIAALTATRLSGTLTAGLTFAPGVDAANYCTAKPNSLGCSPSIGAHGYASVSASEGLDVWGSNALNNTSGLLLFGASGRNTLPWHGGTLCVKPPLVRTALRSSGGDPWPAQNCSGRWLLDLNAALSTLPTFAAGTTLDLQWFGRDPGFAPPGNFQLSNGLELTLRP
jgi:hypothetical protein